MLKREVSQKESDKKPSKPAAMDEDRVIGKIYDRKLLGRLLKYGLPYWYLIAFAV